MSSALKSFTKVSNEETVARKFVLTYSSSLASDGSGTLQVYINMDPSAAYDWGLVSGYYDEFRVMGARLHLVSEQQFSVTKINTMGFIIFDNDSSTVNSFSAAGQYANKKMIPSVFNHTNGRTYSVTYARPVNKTSPIPWIDVAAPTTSLGSIQVIFPVAGLSTSTTYFSYAIEWMIEVRGRR